MPYFKHQILLIQDLLIPFTARGNILIQFGCRKAATNARVVTNLKVILNKAVYSPRKSIYRLQTRLRSRLYNGDT